mmetsp:Transcript_50893/g.80728  ORF Transcript_50893/g.80728 Transcript_50893/m.80728 type:complete len:504 (-) Transcript_50893:151-1662(-)
MQSLSSPTLENRRASEACFRGESGSVFGTSVLEQRRSSDSRVREDSRNSTASFKSAKVGVFVTDKENRSPAPITTKKEASALWVKLRETEAELEKSRSALKPLEEATAKIENQEQRIRDLQEQNRELKDSLDLKQSEHEELKQKYESLHEENAQCLIRFQKKVVESLDHMNEDIAKLGDRTEANAHLASRRAGNLSGTESNQHDILFLLRCFQKKVIKSLDYMSEEIAQLQEITDANTRRMHQVSTIRSSAGQGPIDSTMYARLAAAKLVHKCVVSHLVSEIEGDVPTDVEDPDEERDDLKAHCETLEEERSSWKKQNHELALTVQMLIQENQQLEAQNKHTSKIAAVFEKKYEDIAGQNARQMGHINHKQKIQHTLQLKEEISELRTSLSLAQKRCFQLESGLTTKQLDHLLASFGASIAEDGAYVVGESRRSKARLAAGTNNWKSERMKIDLQHLISLIQGVVLDCHGEESTNDLTSLFQKLRAVMQQRVRKEGSQKTVRH